MTGRCVVLLSGGIDSSTTMAIAGSEGYEISALSFDYGQRHSRELESARAVAAALGASRHLVTRFDLREIGGSVLTGGPDLPVTGAGGGEGTGGQTIPATYVPARNTIFLSFALAWAEVLGAPDIFIGANAVDYSGYPDCRPEYLTAYETMANLATRVSVEGRIRFSIRAPLLHMTKAAIIRKGIALGLDYSLTWSCYDPQKDGPRSSVSGPQQMRNGGGSSLITRHEYVACGRCDSCLIRARGFGDAGIPDPAHGRGDREG